MGKLQNRTNAASLDESLFGFLAINKGRCGNQIAVGMEKTRKAPGKFCRIILPDGRNAAQKRNNGQPRHIGLVNEGQSAQQRAAPADPQHHIGLDDFRNEATGRGTNGLGWISLCR